MGKHDHASCQHEGIKYCRHCNVVFCNGCDITWHAWTWTCTTGLLSTGMRYSQPSYTTVNSQGAMNPWLSTQSALSCGHGKESRGTPNG